MVDSRAAPEVLDGAASAAAENSSTVGSTTNVIARPELEDELLPPRMTGPGFRTVTHPRPPATHLTRP